MSEQTYYFTGEGVFHDSRTGKDIQNGQPLPADIPQETLERMKKKGKASATRPTQPGSAEASELGRLRDRIQALTVERDQAQESATRNCDEIIRLQGELATVTTERDQASAEAVTARVDIQRLQGELTTVTSERDAARETVVGLEQTVAQLTAQITSTDGKKK